MTDRLNSYPQNGMISAHRAPLGEHALVAISTFNSYFSIENMEKLFFWTHQNFLNFNVFFMDGASIFNLMAMGYDEQKAFKKTKNHDNNLKNRIIKSLTNINFDFEESKNKIVILSDISQNQRYIDIYNSCVNFFEENNSFKKDCLDITRTMLANKMSKISEDALNLAVKYLLAELPLWFNTPYILNINSSTFIYKDLSFSWQKICYHYNLLSSNQEIMIKSILE